jgi:hypothetical protein
MSRFERKYTDRQRLAVGRAQVDHGMSAQQAIDAFHAGALADDEGQVPPPAAPMPKRTAHDLAAKVRQSREGRKQGLEKAEPAAARAELGRRLMVAADRLTRRLERKSKTGTKDADLADALLKAARAAREVAAFSRADEAATPNPPPASTPKGSAPAAPVTSTPLGDIAAEIDREDRSAAATRRQHPSP